MQESDVGIPGSPAYHAKPKRMVFRETKIVRAALVHERKSAGAIRVPGVCRNQIEVAQQQWLGKVNHQVPNDARTGKRAHRSLGAQHPLTQERRPTELLVEGNAH
jgi:hypothetical protein